MRCLYLFLCFFAPLLGLAQNYSFSQYEVDDGLVQSSVNCFLQDHFGNLWVGTEGGLSRFDGENFQNYSLQDGLLSNRILGIEQWGDSLLITTPEGLSVFDGKKMHNYPLADSTGSSLKIYMTFKDTQERIWMLANTGQMATFTGDSIVWQGQSKLTYVTGMTRAKEGQKIWMSTYNGGLYTFKNGQFTEAPASHKLNAIQDVLVDSENRFWVLSERLLYLYEPNSGILTDAGMELPGFGAAYKLLEDSHGMIWVATSKGTFSYDPGTRQIDPRSISYPGSVIRNIYHDRSGNLWFGSFGDGFFRLKGRMITKLRKEDGLNGNVYMSLAKTDQGDYWFGGYGSGLSLLKEGKIKNFTVKEGLSNNFVTSLATRHNHGIWIGTLSGLNYFDGSTFRQFYKKDGLPGNRIFQIHQTRERGLLVATDSGNTFLQKGEFSPVLDKTGSPFNEYVHSIHPLHDHSLLLLSGDAIYRLQGRTATPFLPVSRFQGGRLTTVAEDKNGDIWIGGINGQVYRYDVDLDKMYHINALYNLPDFMLYSMVFTDYGHLILGTQKGLTQLRFFSDGGLESIQTLDKDDGFLGVEANSNATLKDDDGSLWFGTVKGIYQLDPVEQDSEPAELRPYLTSVKLFYEEIDWQNLTDSVSNWYQIPRKLELDHKNNHLVFGFRANCLNKPKDVFYSFMLQGYEENWSPATDRQEAVYPNLPPGEYSFKVKARSPAGIWTTKPLVYEFSITPPYWQTWWFYLLLLLSAILLLRLYIYWNLKQERDQRVQLELEVKGRTREIQALNNTLEKRVHERTAALALSNRKFEVEFELRKLDQEKLASREREYRQLVHNLREIIFKTDLRGRFTFVNERWQEQMGFSTQESVGQYFTDFFYGDHFKIDEYAQVLSAMLNRELPYYESEIRLQRKDGEVFWAKVAARIEYDEEGHEVIGTNGSLVDIDQRKKAEFALRASEDRYKFLTENTQDIITLQSPDLYYYYASPRIYEVAGHEPEEMIGKFTLDYLHPDDRETYLHLRREVTTKKTSQGIVVRFIDGQGDFRWYETFLKPNYDENGELQGFISSSRDVNEKVELSKEIDKVRKKVAQDFHDEMGNNLASISVLSQLIQNKLGNAGQEVEALLNKIDVASKNLFNGTRDFIWAIDPKNDNLQEVYYNLKDFGEELFDNTGIRFYASMEQEEKELALKLPSGWSRQLVLIFKEAFTNALKYADASAVNMSFVVRRNEFIIEVADDGKGLSEKQQMSLRGIKNMRERAGKIRTRLIIASVPGQGSRIRLGQKLSKKSMAKLQTSLRS